MTTARSPVAELRAQANAVAAKLKAAERGQPIAPDPAGKIADARGRNAVKFAVVMDDKVLTIEMPWAKIRETSEAGIAEYVLDQMREAGHVPN